MRTEFIIYRGNKLTFFDTYLEILDVNKWTKGFNIITPVLWILYGIMSILRYNKTGDSFLLWSGLIIIILWIIGGIYNLQKRFDKKITYVNVDKVIIKRDLLDRLKADFIIKNSMKKRTVLLDFDRYSLKDFESVLIDKNIKIENK